MSQQCRRRPRWIRTAIVLALAASSMAYVNGARGGTPGPEAQSGDTSQPFAADLRVRHSRAVSGSPPPFSVGMSYHIERARSRAGWTTTVTLTELTGIEARSVTGAVLDNPFLVTRMEVDEGGAGTRLFNRRGELVREPTKRDRDRLGLAAGRDPLAGWAPAGGSPDAVAALAGDAWPADFAAPSHVERRRRALEATFGPPVERKNGFSRHVRVAGDEVTEALVDPELAVPTEVVTKRAGAVVSRTTIAFDRDGKGGLARKRLRAERAVPGRKGEMDLLDVDLVRATPRAGGGR
ncbi:MAG: hypothetical protein IT184_14420 [Acidobacteria bacterium]|nr:hypothetical protein [Acidobacteriota bacterium]